MSHVRFPMMSHHQLVELLLHPVSKSHTNMIVEKIREGLRFHKGKEEIGPNTDNRIYTPRLYTTEKFCASLSVDHFYELPSYHCRSLLFSSQRLACPHLSSWVQWWISKAKSLWKWSEKGSRQGLTIKDCYWMLLYYVNLSRFCLKVPTLLLIRNTIWCS